MGKASRSKGNRTEQDRAQKAREQALSRFLSRAGVVLPSSTQQLWSNIEAKLGAGFADDFDAAIRKRFANNAAGLANDGAVYDLMYRDLDSALVTMSFVAPMLRTWALHFQTLELPDGPMVDLGSGNGVMTCFYAAMRPAVQVTGVEIHPGGVACGQALAERLGLTNVTFVQGDALAFDASGQFSVVTSVAGLIEMEGYAPEPAHPFSSLRSAQASWSASRSPLAESAQQLLVDGGVFVSMERLPNFGEFARWLGAVQSAGLSIDLASSAHVSWTTPPNGHEAMPVVYATKRSPAAVLEFDELVNWYRGRGALKHGNDDFLVELELFEAQTLRLVAGRHFDVRDDHGEGQTRIYVIDRGADSVLYMSTSRGMRAIMRKARDPEPLVSEFQSMLFHFSASPEIVGQRGLSAADLEDELGRAVLSV